MTFKRGIIQQPSQTPAPSTHVIKARTIAPPKEEPSRIISSPEQFRREPAVRGVLFDTGGKLVKGLSQATIAAHQAYTGNQSEQCKTCGEMCTPEQMKTIIGNAYNSNNPLRMCVNCQQLSYKDPNDRSQEWKPRMPAVRFDRERANPYDPRTRDTSMKDLVTRDTYHSEKEVDSDFRLDNAPNVGRWSGGGRTGHVVTPESLERSRAAAARVRR